MQTKNRKIKAGDAFVGIKRSGSQLRRQNIVKSARKRDLTLSVVQLFDQNPKTGARSPEALGRWSESSAGNGFKPSNKRR